MSPAGGNGRSGFALALEATQAPRAAVDARTLPPMLAEAIEEPFSAPDWIFELKIDGYRALLVKDGDAVQIRSRRGKEMGPVYPELLEAMGALPVGQAILDGEIAVLDARGRPSFSGMQQRSGLSDARAIAQATRDFPVVHFAFDLLAAEGRDLRGLPLLERKRLLRLLLEAQPARAPALRFVEHVAGSEGERLYARAAALGLEGVVGKRASSPYRAGRSRDWRKLRVQRSGDFAIVGLLRGEGSRKQLGSLHLACWDGEQFIYVGAAGSGLREQELEPLARALEAHAVAEPPCIRAPRSRHDLWSEPLLCCEIRYLEVTQDGLLRQPVFVRLRDDKAPRDCPPPPRMPASEMVGTPPIDAGEEGQRGPAAAASASGESRAPDPAGGETVPGPSRAALAEVPAEALRETKGRLKISNPNKLLWPDDGISKTDLIGYHRDIAPYILPWLRDRPATLTRYPDGIAGKSFFQKHAPSYTPAWVRVARAAGSDPIDAIVCDDLDTLLYVANLANIPLHIPSARLSAPDRPDYLVIDLDPKSAPFSDVIRCALALRELCERLALPSFVKTSGQSGLHVLLPLGGLCSHAQARQLAELIARLVEARHPKLCTLERTIEKRRGRVYLDIGQNGESRTVAAAYSVRPIAGARASAPLLWDEVNDALDPAAFTLRTLPSRARKLGHGRDPLLGALTERPDLERALARLAELSRAPAGR